MAGFCSHKSSKICELVTMQIAIIWDLYGYQFYGMSKLFTLGSALLSSFPKHISRCSHTKLKFFKFLYGSCLLIKSHTCMSTSFCFMVRSWVISKCPFYFSLSMSNWPYISYADIVCGFIIPFWTIKGMVNIKNRGWNLMGIARYAIRLVHMFIWKKIK